MSAFAVLSPAPAGPTPVADELDLDAALEMGLEALLGLLAPPDRPWLQQTVTSLAPGVWRWLRLVPRRAARRAAGWGGGPDGVWCAW